MAIAERISRITSKAQRVLNRGADKVKAKSYEAEGRTRERMSDQDRDR